MLPRHTLTVLAVSPALLLASGGCMFLPVPEPAPPPPTPEPLPAVVFDATAGQPRGLKLNDPAQPPLDPKAAQAIPTPGAPAPAAAAPHAFLLAAPQAAHILVLQPMNKVNAGKNTDGSDKVVPRVGAPDSLNPVRLAGVIAPSPPATGAANAMAAVTNWCAGKELDVDIDPKYPEDAQGRRLVHVFFKADPTGKLAGQTLSLNRMLVRSGYAIVDLYSPTSFDQKEWLMDEAFARKNRRGLWQTNAFAVLQQRLPSTGTGARANVTVRTGVRPNATPSAQTPKIVPLPPGVKVTPPPIPSGPSAPVAPPPGGSPPMGGMGAPGQPQPPVPPVAGARPAPPSN